MTCAQGASSGRPGNSWPKISLSGSDWRVMHCLPGEYSPATGINPQAHVESVGPDWLPARVPGDVQSDAIDAGLIPDPNYGLDSRQCEWTYQRDWVYYRNFSVDRPAPPAERVVLRFDGVDYQCDVFLNGRWLGRHVGAWTAFEFDVTEKITYDKANSLTVVVRHAPDEVCQWGRTSEVRTMKARFAYGWDWCTRLVPLGIWQDVSLIARGPAYLADIFTRPRVELDGPKVAVEVEIKASVSRPGPLSVKLELSLDGRCTAASTIEVQAKGGEETFKTTLKVPDPKLWYPNGYGDQPVYRLTCTLSGRDNQPWDTRSVPVGLRKLEWIHNAGAGSDALPYTIRINGRRIYIKGWNWAPVRQLYGREHADVYRRRLELAKDAHCTLLRVWGGGLAERELFYNLCDRFGILVWQETFLSSACQDNHPLTDPGYIKQLTDCVRDVVVQKRNHPSLVVWCGGNELCVRGESVDVHGNILQPEIAGFEWYKNDPGAHPWRPLQGDHPLLAAIERCVRALDPDRHWLPTSASGPWENASPDYAGQMHDVHGPWMNSGPEGHYRFFNAVDMMLHSEFGCDGASSVRAIERFVPEGYRWPMNDRNPVAWHHGRMWTGTNLPRTETWFGKIDDLATFVRASQYVQAEGLRYAIEAHRRRKWQSSGGMMWHFAEPWPNVCDTCSVDFYNQPKPAYFAVARANRPVHVSVRYEAVVWANGKDFPAELWGHNSNAVTFNGRLTTSVWSMDGERLAERVADVGIDPESTQRWDRIDVPGGQLPELFLLYAVLTDTAGNLVSHHWSVHSTRGQEPMAGLRHLPAGEVDVKREENSLCVTNTGRSVVVGLWLEPDLDTYLSLSDNWFCLVPGETRTITITGQGSFAVSAWNIHPFTVLAR